MDPAHAGQPLVGPALSLLPWAVTWVAGGGGGGEGGSWTLYIHKKRSCCIFYIWMSDGIEGKKVGGILEEGHGRC